MRSIRSSVLIGTALFLVLCLFATPKRYYCSDTALGTTVCITPIWRPGPLSTPAAVGPSRYEFLGIDAATLLFELLVSVAVGAALWASSRESEDAGREGQAAAAGPAVREEPEQGSKRRVRALGEAFRSSMAALHRSLLGLKWRLAARRERAPREPAAQPSMPAPVPVQEEPPDEPPAPLEEPPAQEPDTYEEFTRRMERLLEDDGAAPETAPQEEGPEEAEETKDPAQPVLPE